MFHKATKTKSKLRRLALFGPSGAGKIYTALQIATGIGGSIAMIDTEYGSGRFQDTIIEKPGSQFGSEIHSWLSEGADPPEPSGRITGSQPMVPTAVR